MTTKQLHDMANYLKAIVDAEGSPAAKWSMNDLNFQITCLNSAAKEYEQNPSEQTARIVNGVRGSVERIALLILRNVAENV